jgi:hypothetical protein
MTFSATFIEISSIERVSSLTYGIILNSTLLFFA